MAVSLKKWLLEWISGGKGQLLPAEQGCVCQQYASELYVRELAFWICVNLIANTISKCEFRTYSGGTEIKEAEYYRWNAEPNVNQSGVAFIRQLITSLYRNNEALVVEQGKQLLVADGFQVKPYALYENVFSGVSVGDFLFSRTFLQGEVLYFQLSGQNMRVLINGLYETYQKLIDYGAQSYQKSRGTKGILEMDTVATGNRDFQERYKSLREKEFRTWAQAENGILPLWRGMKYTDLGSKTYSNEGTRDIRSMIDDVMDFTAGAFQIPPALISKEVEGTEDAEKRFLAFCIEPLARLLEEEINRKIYGYDGFRKGNYLRIDTSGLRHISLLDAATAIDKLISSGAFCINDVRRAVGDSEIDEEWARRHFITKNYEPVETAEGGEPE